MKQPVHPQRIAQRGFVLVLTLWVLVIVAIAASYFAQKVDLAVQLAQQTRQNAQTSIDMAASRAEILYRLATTSMNIEGLGNGNTLIKLDNRSYRAIGDTFVQLQDNRGLFNLNHSGDDRLLRFLGAMGIAPDQRGLLVDTLRDYIDTDELERLNGAEAPQYLAQGLPLPRNSYLLTPFEVNSIIGWRNAPQFSTNSKMAQLCTTSAVSGFNPNTSPLEVLATLPGMTDELAKQLIKQRDTNPILSIGHFANLTGIPEIELEMLIFVTPSDSVRITQTAANANGALQYSVKLTPMNDVTPWRIEYFSRIQGSDTSTRMPAASEPGSRQILPARSTAAPNQSPL